uniref:Uncharacterized protein n=1 Tax=Romanomermis culicivorax TaxID=13658 RepID=A0A915KLI2_ROMCU
MKLLSSVTSATMSRTFLPKFFSNSSKLVFVSSTVSCKMAACKTSPSPTEPSSHKIWATPIGWLMYKRPSQPQFLDSPLQIKICRAHKK